MKIILLYIGISFLFISCTLSPITKNTSKHENDIKNVKVEDVTVPELNNKVEITQTNKESSKESIEYKLTSFKIDKKKNGVLISLDYTGDDPKKNIKTFFSGDNFFNISFYKGEFTENVKKYIYNKAIVGKVKFFDFDDSVQITVRLRNDHKSSYIDTNKDQITISVFN